MPKLVALALCLLMSGCTLQNYVIEDTRTGQKYLTSGVLDDVSGPGLRIYDELTGRHVRVEAYKLTSISHAAFEDAKRTGVAP